MVEKGFKAVAGLDQYGSGTDGPGSEDVAERVADHGGSGQVGLGGLGRCQEETGTGFATIAPVVRGMRTVEDAIQVAARARNEVEQPVMDFF